MKTFKWHDAWKEKPSLEMFGLDILEIWVDYCEGKNDCSACKLGNACDKLGDAYATMINDLCEDKKNGTTE